MGQFQYVNRHRNQIRRIQKQFINIKQNKKKCIHYGFLAIYI